MSVDLGKVHTKIELSSEIPGVTRDVDKLRKNFSWLVSLNAPDSQVSDASHNITRISVIGNDGKTITSGMIPQPTYEPIDNYMVNRNNSTQTADEDIYWKELGYPIDPDSDKPNSGFAGLWAPQYKSIVIDQDRNVLRENRQKWVSEVAVSSPSKYSEEEYDKNSITYKGEGFLTKSQRAAADKKNQPSEKTKVEENVDDNDVEETFNTSWVRQKESLPGTWWGIRNEFPFKDRGWPFWVTIRPSSINLPKKKGKRAVMSIMISDPFTNNKKSKDTNSRDQIGSVELVIDNLGGVMIVYQMKSQKSSSKKNKKSGTANTSGGQAQTGSAKDGNNNGDMQSSYSYIPLDKMSHLSAAFTSNGEIRIGFMQIMGRLCIYTDPQNYQVVNFIGSNGRFVQYNLDSPKMSIYGYGCTASIAAFPMTFKKRAWSVLPNMDPKISSGFKYPPTDQNGIRAGSLSDGRLISKPNNQKNSQKSGNKKLYSGVFHYYDEVLNDANDFEGKSHSAAKKTTGESSSSLGMLNPWGKLHLVRSGPVEGISDEKHFWFVYLETEDLQRSKSYDPATGEPLKENNNYVSGPTYESVGFPVFYGLMAYKPKVDEDNPKVVSDSDIVDISEDVVSMNFNYELDSPRPSVAQRSGNIKVFNTDGKYSDYLAKARGVKVWMKWDDHETTTFSDDDVVFTGIAFGRTTAQAPGEEYVTFECTDHWTVLEGIQIKNSPFYDGFYIGSVLEDLCHRSGVDFSDDLDKSQSKKSGVKYYFLGQSTVYSKPLYRFSAENTIKDCIMETIKNFEVYVYFDEDGVLRMAPVPGGFLLNKNNYTWDPGIKKVYYFNFEDADSYDQVIIDSLEMTSTLSSSIYNSIFVRSADKDTGRLIIGSRGNRKSLTNADDIGYLGFVKEIVINRPDLGSQEAAEHWAEIVRQMYSKPGFSVEFNTPGHKPPVRPGQFIRLVGNTAASNDKKFRVTKISHDYNASSNRWQTSIGAYQVEPASTSFDPSKAIAGGTPPEGD